MPIETPPPMMIGVRLPLLVACFAIIALTSCGTLHTLGEGYRGVKPMPPRFPHYLPHGAHVPRVFSGTSLRLRQIFAWERGDVLWFLIDLPLCLVADSLVLPVTIPQQFLLGSYASAAPPESFFATERLRHLPLADPAPHAGKSYFVGADMAGDFFPVLYFSSDRYIWSAEEKWRLPVETDGDVADLYFRVNGERHPTLRGEMSAAYRRFWSRFNPRR